MHSWSTPLGRLPPFSPLMSTLFVGNFGISVSKINHFTVFIKESLNKIIFIIWLICPVVLTPFSTNALSCLSKWTCVVCQVIEVLVRFSQDISWGDIPPQSKWRTVIHGWNSGWGNSCKWSWLTTEHFFIVEIMKNRVWCSVLEGLSVWKDCPLTCSTDKRNKVKSTITASRAELWSSMKKVP